MAVFLRVPLSACDSDLCLPPCGGNPWVGGQLFTVGGGLRNKWGCSLARRGWVTTSLSVQPPVAN